MPEARHVSGPVPAGSRMSPRTTSCTVPLPADGAAESHASVPLSAASRRLPTSAGLAKADASFGAQSCASQWPSLSASWNVCLQPEGGSQVSAVQRLLSSQLRAAPPVHTPLLHASFVVHAFPSLQAAPLVLAGLEQRPVDGSQTPVSWH